MIRLYLCVLSVLVLAVPTALAQRDLKPIEGAHKLAFEAQRDAPTHPTLLAANNAPIQPLVPRAELARPCATVFGYLPYWESAANLRYDLLSHVACFSVEVNSNGSLGNDHGWPWTSVINDAHAAGAKIVLVATLFNGASIKTLITNTTYKNNFFANIKAKMLEGDADGLNIDFESGTTWQSDINAFMADLTNYLHTEIPGSEVTFAGPAVNWSNRFDLDGLATSCDGIFIMGYAFAGSWSSTTGANAPMTGGSINITDTVLDEYADVVQNNPDKLILGVPYYGNHWTTSSSAAHASVNSYIGSTRFRNDESDAQTYGLLWDNASQTPWYRWQVGGTWHQVWFDNADSLGIKFDLAITEGLQGVGMWALNYDGAQPELWDALSVRFGGCGSAAGCCDMDADGDVDNTDVALFLWCMQGPDLPYAPGNACLDGDDDDDFDVDMRDFAALQRGFGS